MYMEKVINANIKQLIDTLYKIGLGSTHCDVTIDEETNVIKIVGIETLFLTDQKDLTIDQIEGLLD